MKKIVLVFALLLIFFSVALAKINLNTASEENLTTLDYIGNAKAEAIVNYRENQEFKSIDEFTKVDGVGDRVLEMNKDQICVGNGDC